MTSTVSAAWLLAIVSYFRPRLAVLSRSGISYKFLVRDTDWYVRLVSAIATQKLPFVNALSGKEVLHYHFSGDVLPP
jgi:hypothetical protein